MRIRHLEASAYRPMPWKNGLGVTTEIARFPPGGDFDWRISVAAVSVNGPFSLFPGCDRIIIAIEGGGMQLRHHDPETSVSLERWEPWSFSGDAETECVLSDGPIRDFNIITRRDRYGAAASVLHLQGTTVLEVGAGTSILYGASGSAAILVANRHIPIACGESLLFEHEERPESITVESAEDATLIQVELFARRA